MVDLTEDLTKDERDLAQRVLSFSATEVRETMVPRTDWISLGGGETVNRLIEVALETGYSRLPICGDSVDEVLGIMHIKQAGQLQREARGNEPLSQHVQPALTIPESLSAFHALTQLRDIRHQMAIVIDEFGQVVGLVTAEDLLEELVGEVFDESDRTLRKWRRVDDGSYVVDGTLSLKELSGVLGVRLPLSEDYETLGGLILDSLGRIPIEGEHLEVEGIGMEILKVDRRRIKQVRLRQVS